MKSHSLTSSLCATARGGVVPFSRLYPLSRQRVWGIGDRSERNCPIASRSHASTVANVGIVRLNAHLSFARKAFRLNGKRVWPIATRYFLINALKTQSLSLHVSCKHFLRKANFIHIHFNLFLLPAMFSLRIFTILAERERERNLGPRRAVHRNIGKTARESRSKIQHFCGCARKSVSKASNSSSGQRPLDQERIWQVCRTNAFTNSNKPTSGQKNERSLCKS